MAVTELPQRFAFRLAKTPRRALQPPISLSPTQSQCSGAIEIPPKSLKSWDGVETPVNSPTTSSHRSSFSRETTSDAGSPVPAMLLSPISVKEDSVGRYSLDLSHFTVPRSESLKRKLDDDSDGSDDDSVTLPGFESFETLLSYPERLKHSHATSLPLTPSTTSEPGYTDVYSRRPSLLFMPQDTITEKLNCLRKVENKDPLPPLEGLCEPPREITNRGTDRDRRRDRRKGRFMFYRDCLKQADHTGLALYNSDGEPCQQPSPPPETKKERAKPKEGHTHCNIKYWVEELDYIRYQRVDLAQTWPLVASKFHAKFPFSALEKNRQVSGLQGVNYRQNKRLPRIIDGQLVFMENGHVEPVCIKTREQTDKKHLYTLVYLFPERAQYPWMLPKDRQRAAELSDERIKQMEDERLEATERGTYVEKLPSHIPCGCCPGEDRERNQKKLKTEQPPPKKRQFVVKSKL
ncbi:hypothetical protein HD806DRAFT_542420 [Xylariaceae sp. AK1471]|nr:hypothetical protein HD806DRAFT_542420 [Xylariaceae sp. AK1471]